MSVKIDESSGVGTYYCHAETPGYSKITSRPAEVLMTGRPKIRSPQRQTGVEGENVHINCDAISIPEAKSITWTYHDSVLDDSEYSLSSQPLPAFLIHCSTEAKEPSDFFLSDLESRAETDWGKSPQAPSAEHILANLLLLSL